MGPEPLHAPLLDRLIEALDTVRRGGVPTRFERKRAWDEAFDAILDFSSSLDPVRQPEVSTHLQAVCDACLARLDEARLGRPDRIEAAISLLVPIRAAARAVSPLAASHRVLASACASQPFSREHRVPSDVA